MKKLLAASLLSAAALFATPVASVTLSGVPSSDPILGNVYVSPYTLTMGSQQYAALCIDFADDAYVGEKWNAYLSTDGGDISNTYHPASAQQYEEAAYIFSQITKPGITAQKQTDLQEAVWDIMAPGYWGTDNTYAPDAAALQYMTDAQNNYTSVIFSNYTIVSSTNTPHVQEYLIQTGTATPEPASCILLGSGLLATGAFRFLRRRKS